MKKTETIRELRDVLCGNSAHTWIGIDRKKRGYEIYTSTNNSIMEMNFQHCCNEMTLKGAKEILENAERDKDVENKNSGGTK